MGWRRPSRVILNRASKQDADDTAKAIHVEWRGAGGWEELGGMLRSSHQAAGGGWNPEQSDWDGSCRSDRVRAARSCSRAMTHEGVVQTEVVVVVVVVRVG